MRWVDTVAADQCPVGFVIEQVVEGHVLAIANVKGMFKVTDGICPHQGGSIGKGTLHHYDNCVVRCPWHGWEYDLTSGCSLVAPQRIRVRSYQVKIADGHVLVTL